MHVLILFLLIFLLVIQGGFFASSFLLAGMLGCVVLLFVGKKILFTAELKWLIVIAVFYFVSVLINGVSISTLSQTMLPMTCLIFGFLLQGLDETNKGKLRDGLEIIALLSSIAGILCFLGVFSIPGGMNAGRLQFTFQYANVAGTWFAANFVLMRDSKKRWIQVSSIFAMVALLLTKSVGAILVWGLMQVFWIYRQIKDKKSKKAFYIIVIPCMAGMLGIFFVFWERLSQAAYTLVERLIHSYDGLKVLLSHPFGIGAGNWQYVYPFYQSAQYEAGVIHNSYVQIGVDAGWLPMIVMIAFLIFMIIGFIKKKTTINEAILIILLHSVLEYSLSFACIDIFLLILLVLRDDEKKKTCKISISRVPRCLIGTGCFLLFAFSFWGNQKLKNIDTLLVNDNAMEAQKRYEEIPHFLRNGYKEKELYVKALLSCGRYEEAISYIEEAEKTSSVMMKLELMAKYQCESLTIDDLLLAMNKQPYNKDFINQMSIYISDDMFSEEERSSYLEELEHINTFIEQWPACWLNNQEELRYETEN